METFGNSLITPLISGAFGDFIQMVRYDINTSKRRTNKHEVANTCLRATYANARVETGILLEGAYQELFLYVGRV
jgi:hypothetical protein